jgi:hypothetical protein
MTKLKIVLCSQEEYVDFLKFAYSKDETLIFNEEYKQQIGAHKEPMIVAIIAALGSAGVFKLVQSIVREFLVYKEKKMDHELNMTKEKNRSDENKLELSFKHGGETEYKSLSIDTFNNATNISSLKIDKE